MPERLICGKCGHDLWYIMDGKVHCGSCGYIWVIPEYEEDESVSIMNAKMKAIWKA